MENAARVPDCSCGPATTKGKAQNSFELLPQLAKIDYENGYSVVLPADEPMPSAASIVKSGETVLNILCHVFPKICAPPTTGGGNGGGGTGGCYTIIGPDGTKITICPPGRTAIV